MTQVNESTAVINENMQEIDANNDLQMTIAATIVEDYDYQIQKFTADLTETNDLKSVVYEAQTLVDQLYDYDAVDTDGDGTVDSVSVSQAELEDLTNMMTELGLSTAELPEASGQSSYDVSLKTLDSTQNKLDNKLDDLNSTSELKLIRFQSLLDARKQALLQLSNMINSSSQTAMAIIQNFKN